jgi:hypothetical protein
MGTLTRADLVGKHIIWLLSINYAGVSYRFSSETVDVPTDTSGYIHFDGQVSNVEVEEKFDFFDYSPSIQSYAFDLIFPDDVAELVQQGHSLSSGTGELAKWITGRNFEDRYIVLANGRIIEPEYGEAGDPVSFSLEQNAFEDVNRLIPTAASVVTETWPNRDGNVDTKLYPTIFGAPGPYVNSLGSSLDTPATPAYIVDTSAIGAGSANVPLLIAGHEVYATSVKVYDMTASLNNSRSVSHVRDALGRVVAVVYLDGNPAGTLPAVAGNEYQVSWTAGGGLVNPSRTNYLKGAGEILTHFLEMTALPVDIGRASSQETLLNTYTISGYTDTDDTVWDWLTDNLLPLLPVSIVNGSTGLYPLVWDMDVPPGNIKANLIEGKDITRTPDRVSYENKDIINDIKFDFALNNSTGGYRTYTMLTGGQVDDGYRFKSKNLYSKLSYDRYGQRYVAMESDIVYDRLTARSILNWMSRYNAFDYRTVKYYVDDRFGWLELGDTISITDTKLHFDEQIVIVKGIEWADSSLVFELVIVDDPPRDARL